VDVFARGDAPSITVQDEIEGVTETVFRVIADSGNTTFQTGTTMATLSNAVTLDPAGGVLEVHGDVRSNVVRANTVTVDTLDITGEMELELLKVRGHVAEIGSNNTADTSTDTGLILTTRTKHWPSNATATFTYANYASTVDTIGFSVDLNDDGDRMIVGNANDVGKVFIYHKQNGVWTNTPTAVFNEVDSSEYFGICVAMNGAGTRAFVGARGNDDGGSNRGKIYVFDYTGASWNSTATVELPGQSDTEQMGWTIRSNRAGTRIVTGGRFNDESGTNLGRVYVFEYSNGSWNTTPTDFEAPSGGSQFGVSVAINAEGTRIAAISYYHVRVYDYVSGSWQTTPTFEDYTGGTESASCSMNAAGDVIAVSRISNYTKVYHLTGSTWELRTTLFTGEELTTNISCSMNDAGDRLAIGNRNTLTDNLDEAGSVYVFDYVNGAWNSNPTAIIYGSVANARFAGAFNSVALNASGDAFAVGAYADDQEGTDVGRVYVYEQSGESNVAIAYDGNDTLHVGYTSNTVQDGAFLVDTSKNFKTKVAGEFHVSRNINVGYSAEQKESIGILLDAKEKFWEKTKTLTGGGNEFGYHLDISNDGNRLIVCDRANDTANVYHRTSEGGWGVDPVKTYSSADFFCVGISGDGNRIAVGGDSSNLVEVYDYDASTETWGSTSIVSFTGNASSRFGRRFAMNYDGTVFVIGADKDDTSGTNDGRAYIKEYINGSWVTTELASPVSSSTEAEFGVNCDINDAGDRVVVVAPGTDNPGTDNGSIHVYHKENGVWSEVFTYSANSTDFVPVSARINRTGDKIIFGTYISTLIATDVGRAYLYSYVNGSWTYETDFLPGTTGKSGFGIACDISDSGDRAFIGALFENSMNNSGTDYHGAVYIFDKINGKWNKNPTRVILETPVRETLTEWDSLKCDTSGEILAIGGADQPNVYVYELTPKNSSVAIVYDGNNTLDIGYTSSEPGSKNIKIDTAKPLNLRINGSLHSHARYDLLRRLVSVTSDSANGIMKVEPYAPIFINDSQDDWETYLNVPYYLLGAAGTNTVNNDSNITVTLKCTMTAFLIRKANSWSAVSTTNWSIMDGSGDILSNTSSHDEMRIYIRTLGAGDHSLDTDSALYAFIL
jgi:hypothetical protein